jgi:hypothetical protein
MAQLGARPGSSWRKRLLDANAHKVSHGSGDQKSEVGGRFGVGDGVARRAEGQAAAGNLEAVWEDARRRERGLWAT